MLLDTFWDWLTVTEQKVRDRTLAPIILKVVPRWVHPTHVTLIRGILVLVAVGLYLASLPLLAQVVTLSIAAATDTVDGVLARNRRQATRLGSFLDHYIDWGLGLWLGVVVLLNGLITLGLALWLIIPQVVVAVTDRMLGEAGDQPGRLQLAEASALAVRAQGPELGAPAVAIEAAGAGGVGVDRDPGMQASAVSRFQGTAVLIGFNLMLLGRILDRGRAWLNAGYAFAYLSVFFAVVQAGRGIILVARRRLAVARQ
ncbi:MAG: CDP-alcohol phosphatidyltransferase family protein [Acetobacteraceae bacterium]|nr:CDP-alcohol phosphatidyltransferase family protein [Acetobacteraceae bacterium]